MFVVGVVTWAWLDKWRENSKMMRLNYRPLIFLLLLTAFAGSETITIDFANDQGPMAYRGSGFLVGMNSTTPVDSIVVPLKPRLFRDPVDAAFANYARVKALGATYHMVLRLNSGTLLPYPGTNNSWSTWENHVRATVSKALAANQDFEYDVWNEPNISMFWEGTIPQFYETWRRAVVIIRSLDPDAVIVGPSINNFDLTYLKNFLQYAKTNNVLPTALCWHEIGPAATVRGIAMNVAAMRTFMADQGINIQKIYINEMISGAGHHNPGLIVRHFAEIEKAKVDGACKACWPETSGSNCGGYILDGIVTRTTRYPRAAWWAYKSYADITGRLVGITPAPIPFSVDGVAGQDASKHEARAVLGRYVGSGSLNVLLINLSSVPYLTNTGTIRVVAKRIPNTGEAQLVSPTTTMDASYSIANNAMQFTIPDFPDSNAYALQFTAGGAPAVREVSKAVVPAVWKINPGRASIHIDVASPKISTNDRLSISVHDVQGRIVQTLNGHQGNGALSAYWDASQQAPGVYIFQLRIGGEVLQKDALVIR